MWIFFFFFGGGGGGHFYTLIGRFKVKVQNGYIFWAANFQIFLGIPDIPDFFFLGGGWGLGVNSRCCVQAYV